MFFLILLLCFKSKFWARTKAKLALVKTNQPVVRKPPGGVKYPQVQDVIVWSRLLWKTCRRMPRTCRDCMQRLSANSWHGVDTLSCAGHITDTLLACISACYFCCCACIMHNMVRHALFSNAVGLGSLIACVVSYTSTANIQIKCF